MKNKVKNLHNAKHLNGIFDFYNDEIIYELKVLEKQRKKVLKKIKKAGLIILIITLITQLIVYQLTKNIELTLIGITLITLLFSTLIYQYMIKDYRDLFKSKVIEPLIKHISPELNYFPKSKISKNEFQKSKLYTGGIQHYKGEDLIKGRISGVTIESSEIDAYRYESSGKNRRKVTVFKGLYIIADFNKYFKHHTIIKNDLATNLLGDVIGGWVQSTFASHGELIEMDNREFDKKFVVYGTDQIEARYILTPSMMERMLEYQKEIEKTVSIAFLDNKIHIGINIDEDLFEPKVFTSLLDINATYEYIGSLYKTISFIEYLKLEERLWSKV